MSSAWRAAFEADKEARVRAFLAQAPPAAVAAVRFDCESAPALAERLLCARKGAVPAAVALVRTVAAWRRTRGVRALCAAPLADVLGGLAYDELHFLHAKAYFPYPDRRGRPVYVERTGGADADLLAALTSLDVSRTKLTALPDELGRLTRLESLCASENLLAALPDTLGSLKALKKLLLFKNALTAVPEALAACTALEVRTA